jgi:hypothetical protein
MGKTQKKRKNKKRKVYTKKHYQSGDGMVTSVWGPPLWHYIHTMSFNFPINPTKEDKKNYKNFILSLKNVLPCHYCRDNLKKNFKALPLTNRDLKSRDSFSRWVFKLHELVNTMLGKKSGLKFCDVRERYEHFRSRCTDEKKFSVKNINAALRKTKKKEKEKEKGCTEPLYGKKSKCIVKIVPNNTKGKSFQMDKKCIKKRK